MTEFAQKVLQAGSEKTYLFSTGQAGYILKNKKGQLLGIDLYLSECVEKYEGHMGFKRLLLSILSPFELEFDGLIATHSHLDHFDKDAIPKLMANGKTQLYAAVDCKREIEQLCVDESYVTYVKPSDRCELGDYILEFVSCDHGKAVPDAVGVVVTVDGKKIYVAGDTCLRLDKLKEYKERGPFDIMIAPINGAYGNMNEQDCAELSCALEPRVTIPSHYGMFASHGGNPGLFIEKMQQICPQNQYFLMTLGEGIVL